MKIIRFHTVWFSIAVLVLISFVMYLRIAHYRSINYIGSDEVAYREQAKILAKNINGGASFLVQKYNSTQDLWKFPPPSRMGYLHTVSLLMNLQHRYDEHPARVLSIIANFFTVIFLVIIGVQFFNRYATLYALLFFAVSPMDLTVSVHGYQDALLGLLGVSMLYLALIISFRKHNIILYFLISILGVYCITIKEFGALIYTYCISIALVNLVFRKRCYKNALMLTIIYIVSVILSVLLLANLLGGFGNLVKIIYNVKNTLSENYYATVYQTGPWYLLVRGFWILTPLSYALFSFSIFNMLLIIRKKENSVTKIEPISNVLLYMLLCIISAMLPYSQNYRYLSTIYIFYYLIAGMGFYYLINYLKNNIESKIARNIIVTAVIFTIIFCATIDYNRFSYIRRLYKAYDLPVAVINDLKCSMDYINDKIR